MTPMDKRRENRKRTQPMISQLPKSPVARFTAGLLTGLMLLGGPPLEALQGQVVLVPRESPPEWLAPWLDSPWLEVGSWQGRWEQAGGAVPASRQTGVDPGFSPWALKETASPRASLVWSCDTWTSQIPALGSMDERRLLRPDGRLADCVAKLTAPFRRPPYRRRGA